MNRLGNIGNRKLFTLLATLVLGLVTTVQAPPLSAPARSAGATPSTTSQYYPLVRVVDGDTIVVKINSKNVKVRLIGLDTPELVDPRRPVQCFAKEASTEMHTLVDGQDVRLETDPSQDTYDKYHRLLAYVFRPLDSNPEGLLVNKYMITEGFGHEYTYNLPYKYQKEFRAAEKNARAGGKGLWGPGVCK